MKSNKAHKILIIDDNPNDIYLAKRALSKTGFEVEVEAVMHGEAALELLRNEDDLPSLILLDLNMPGMSGIDTPRRIRADCRVSNITVIIATNSPLESDKNESYAAGADDFLNKAFDMDRFERDIKSVLERWLE